MDHSECERHDRWSRVRGELLMPASDDQVSQQYVESVQSEGASDDRVSQQFVETIQSGAVTSARVSQQYVEVIVVGVAAVAGSSGWAWMNGPNGWQVI